VATLFEEDTAMIEGLKIKVSSAEVKSHLESRANYHGERADWYASQVANLRAGGVHAEDVSHDPVTGLEDRTKNHREKAALFTFMAEHVIPDEEYILAEEDLVRIELMTRHYY
jgi:hypothetical protein